MTNLLSYCGLVDSRISASDKDLPITIFFLFIKNTIFFSEFVKTCDEYVLGLVRIGIVNGDGGNAVGQF
jgi:hypothetical protein